MRQLNLDVKNFKGVDVMKRLMQCIPYILVFAAGGGGINVQYLKNTSRC